MVTSDILFRTLGDPTRRAIFERLCRGGEQTVSALTAEDGVSQPAVSKHLGVLKQAGLVEDRRNGKSILYRLKPQKSYSSMITSLRGAVAEIPGA